MREEPANCWRRDDFTDNSNKVQRPPSQNSRRSHLLFFEEGFFDLRSYGDTVIRIDRNRKPALF